MIWDPVGNIPIPFTDYFAGHSGFGHVSVDINGTTYSMAPGNMHIEKTTSYVKKQLQFRGGVGRVLKLSPEQESKFAASLDPNKIGQYNWLKNNCVNPVQNGLNNVGVDVGKNLLPENFGQALDQSNSVQSYNIYKNITPQRVENGFESTNMLMTSVNFGIDAMMMAAQAAQATAAAAAMTSVSVEGTTLIDIGSALDGL